METALAAIIGIFGIVGFLFATIAFFSVFNALILSALWNWFIVTTFHLPELTIPQAIGLGLVISVVTYSGKSSDGKKPSAAISEAVFSKLLILLVGWIVHGWFM